jgi:sterol desaturase/sphingolipid hydroxylase (fatty acid hydroxylase superfamily)
MYCVYTSDHLNTATKGYTVSSTTSGFFDSSTSLNLGQRLLSWTLLPSALAISIAATLALYHGKVDAMTAQMGVFFITLILVNIGQWAIPFNREWAQSPKRERIADISSWVVLMMIVDPILKRGLMPTLMALTVTLAQPAGGLGLFPTAIPLALQVVLALVIAEFGQYWMHRIAHGGGWLWRVHTMHHSPKRVSLANGFRTNPINMVWHQMAGIFVLMLIGTPEFVIHSMIIVSTAISLFQHINANISFSGWNWIVSTADLHRWHHAVNPKNAFCNFGQNLIIWDQVFGTYRRANGIAPREVGVEGEDTHTIGYWRAVRKSTIN